VESYHYPLDILNENICNELATRVTLFDWLSIVNLDTLIGVIIGGILAIFGSYWVSKKEYSHIVAIES